MTKPPTNIRTLSLSKGLDIKWQNIKNGGDIITSYADINIFLESGILIQEKKAVF